jgi:hypothetical protein
MKRAPQLLLWLVFILPVATIVAEIVYCHVQPDLNTPIELTGIYVGVGSYLAEELELRSDNTYTYVHKGNSNVAGGVINGTWSGGFDNSRGRNEITLIGFKLFYPDISATFWYTGVSRDCSGSIMICLEADTHCLHRKGS